MQEDLFLLLYLELSEQFTKEDKRMQAQMNVPKVKRIIKADRGKLSQVLEWENGTRVELPIEKDGSVKFFDDSKLLKTNKK